MNSFLKKSGLTSKELLPLLLLALLVMSVLLPLPRVASTNSLTHASNVAGLETSKNTQYGIAITSMFSASSPISEVGIPQNNSYPVGIAIGPAGNIWFANANTDSISEYLPSNDTFFNFPIPTTPHLAMIWFLIFDGSGNLWFNDASQPLLWRFTPATHQFANFTTGSPEEDPFGMLYEPQSDEIWFTSTYTDQIGAFQISPSKGSASLVASITLPSSGAPGEVENNGPSGIALGSDGNILVSESFSGRIIEYNPSTNQFTRSWELRQGAEPVGLAYDEAGNLIWFANHASSLFGYVNVTNGDVKEIATSIFSFQSGSIDTTVSLPYWVELTSPSSVWFNEHYGNRIARFDPETMQLFEYEIPTQVSGPLRFAIDNATGAVWFTEFSGNKIGQIKNQSLQPSDGGEELSVSTHNLVLQSGSPAVLVINSSVSSFNSSSSFSGSMNFDGNINSNLTFSLKALGNHSTQISISRGEDIAAGNYTLTVCPEDPSAMPRICDVVSMKIDQSIPAFGMPEQFALYVIAAATILVAVTIGGLGWEAKRRRETGRKKGRGRMGCGADLNFFACAHLSFLTLDGGIRGGGDEAAPDRVRGEQVPLFLPIVSLRFLFSRRHP